MNAPHRFSTISDHRRCSDVGRRESRSCGPAAIENRTARLTPTWSDRHTTWIEEVRGRNHSWKSFSGNGYWRGLGRLKGNAWARSCQRIKEDFLGAVAIWFSPKRDKANICQRWSQSQSRIVIQAVYLHNRSSINLSSIRITNCLSMTSKGSELMPVNLEGVGRRGTTSIVEGNVLRSSLKQEAYYSERTTRVGRPGNAKRNLLDVWRINHAATMLRWDYRF